MTARQYRPHETIDLLERILERVESIDENVDRLVGGIDARLGDFLYRDEYDDHDDAASYL